MQRFLRLVGRAVAVAAVLMSGAVLAPAQELGKGNIRLVVAFPAGGPTDFVARILADKLKVILNQTVIIENKPGANGAVGAEYVMHATADGNTLFFTTVGAVCITPHLRGAGSGGGTYDTLKDFAPVSLIVQNSTVLVVRADSPVQSAKQLADMAKEKPATVPFASTGIGSMPHLALELYQSAAGVKFLHVPYRGAAPALTDLLGGQVQAMFADAPVLMPHIQGGKLRALGVASDRRNEMLPGIQMLSELGYPDTTANNWYGLLAPAATPKPVIAKLNTAVNDALKDPEVRKKLADSGAIPSPTTPEEFGALLKSELARWSKVVRDKAIMQ